MIKLNIYTVNTDAGTAGAFLIEGFAKHFEKMMKAAGIEAAVECKKIDLNSIYNVFAIGEKEDEQCNAQ